MFGSFRTIWVFLRPFGCLTKLRAKCSEHVQKFVPRSRVGILRNERTRSSSLDTKLLFCGILYHLGAFRIVKLPFENRGETFRTSAKVRAMKSRQNFSQRTHPIHSIGHKIDVLVRFVPLGAFGTVLLPYETRCKTGRTSAKVRAMKSRPNFSQRTHPIHPISP